MNALHMLNERITKSFGLRRWLAFWHESQMSDWAGLILGQSPYCTNKNSSQMSVLCSGRGRVGWVILDLSGTLCFKRVLVWKHLTRTQLSRATKEETERDDRGWVSGNTREISCSEILAFEALFKYLRGGWTLRFRKLKANLYDDWDSLQTLRVGLIFLQTI